MVNKNIRTEGRYYNWEQEVSTFIMISLTRQAAEKIRTIKSENEKKYVRVNVNLEQEKLRNFSVDFTDMANNDDVLYMCYGIKILAGSSTRRHFENLKVDYIADNGMGDFKFETVKELSSEM